MDTNQLPVTELGGVDERVPQPIQAADRIVNMTRHRRTGGWDSRIGYERYLFPPAQLWRPFDVLTRIDSLYIHSRHQGAQQTILLESGGTLYQFIEWGDTFRIETVAASRTVPTSAQSATSYVPFGRYVIVLNGDDEALKYSGWPNMTTSPNIAVFPLGFHGFPPAPTAGGVEVDPTDFTNLGRLSPIWAGQTSQEVGLGSSTDSADNAYRWKVAFRMESGSVTPLSPPSNTVTWVTESAGAWRGSRYVVGMEIPVGPLGTVSRLMYRCRNLGDNETTTDEVYYEVEEIPNNTEDYWYDHYGDNQLGSEAPGAADNIVMPCPRARYGEVFAGCLFMDAGTAEETRIYWCNPGAPDTYSALDYFELGGREAGGITGLRAYASFLLVLRENGMDVIRGNYLDGFKAEPLVRGVGGRAGGTMTAVPDLGILLLAATGVYLVTGSLEGGGTVDFRKLSDPIMDTIERVNLDTAARATAAYSHKWREWHCYLPVDGSDKPNLGIVFHVDDGSWSFREDFPVSCIVADYNGDLIFGHHTGDNGAGNPDPSGLFVVSRRRWTGGSYVAATEQVPAYIEANTPPTSTYRSAWHDMGDARVKKRVKHVYLKLLTMGDAAIKLTAYKDYDYTGVDTAEYKQQRTEHEDQAIYDTAVIGTDVWEDHKVTEIRFDVADHSASQFLFELTSTADFVLLGYSLAFTAPGLKVRGGKEV